MLTSTRARLWLAALIVLVALLLPRPASAARPVIVAGREQEIIALFQPYTLGEPIADGWTLHSFTIDVGTIEVWIADPAGEPVAELRLDHPDYGRPGARALPGFAVEITAQPPGSEAAVEAMLTAIASNDGGEFWGTKPVYADEPIEPAVGSWWVQARTWALDGVLLLTLFTAGLLALVVHKLGDDPLLLPHELGERAPADPSPRRRALILLAIVLGGAGLRLVLSPTVAMAPWPYSRVLVTAGLIQDGPLLGLIEDGPVWLTETIVTSTLLLAFLAPLAVYVHARYLLAEQRAALIVAGIVAILPLHLRFSHSDAAFIPSITVSSVCFTLMHAATRERSPRWGWAAVALIAAPLSLVFLVRPLNILYFPLMLATSFVNEGLYRDKPAPERGRMFAAFAVVTAVTLAVGVPNLLQEFAGQVSEGLSLDTLTGAAGVLLSPRMNALLNPEFTPPGLTILAGIGAVDLWRRRRRRLAVFLLLWLLGFLVAHGYVVPGEPYMQARYHLHLIVPFMLLVACGVEAVLRWLRDAAAREQGWWTPARARVAAGALFVYGLASPLIHRHFIANVDFNDQREWLFVQGLRDSIPAECTIIEYVGHGSGARFDRIGAYTQAGFRGDRWHSVEIPYPAPGEPELPAEVVDLLREPPSCLYWYVGMPCWGNKPEGSHQAPACAAVEGFRPLEVVATTSFESRLYDDNLSMGIEQGQPLTLTLYEVQARPR